MKNTIKLTPYKRIVIEANKAGTINFEIVQGLVGGVTTSELHHLTPDQAGAIVSALQWEGTTAWEIESVKVVDYQIRHRCNLETAERAIQAAA